MGFRTRPRVQTELKLTNPLTFDHTWQEMNWLGQTLKSNVKPVRCFIPRSQAFPFRCDCATHGLLAVVGLDQRRDDDGNCIAGSPRMVERAAPFYLVNMLTSSLSSRSKWSTPPKPATIDVVFCFFRNFIISYVDDS